MGPYEPAFARPGMWVPTDIALGVLIYIQDLFDDDALHVELSSEGGKFTHFFPGALTWITPSI